MLSVNPQLCPVNSHNHTQKNFKGRKEALHSLGNAFYQTQSYVLTGINDGNIKSKAFMNSFFFDKAYDGLIKNINKYIDEPIKIQGRNGELSLRQMINGEHIKLQYRHQTLDSVLSEGFKKFYACFIGENSTYKIDDLDIYRSFMKKMQAPSVREACPSEKLFRL